VTIAQSNSQRKLVVPFPHGSRERYPRTYRFALVWWLYALWRKDDHDFLDLHFQDMIQMHRPPRSQTLYLSHSYPQKE